MIVSLRHPTGRVAGTIALPASKSISNRVLMIRALCKQPFFIHNISEAADTTTLDLLLASDATVLDCGPAGTTFRFLTAYLSTQLGTRILTGSERMKQRPIGPLVTALRTLGANIEYVEKDGFPPLRITGATLTGGTVAVDGSTSSQFATALALIAPTLPGGLTLNLGDDPVSLTYLDMTLELMREFGVSAERNHHTVVIHPGKYVGRDFIVESDWSAASYWYAMAVLAQQADITLLGLREESVQGDHLIAPFCTTAYGIAQTYVPKGVRLQKSGSRLPVQELSMDLLRYPDLAQTIAVLCAGLGQPVTISGLQTLRLKETDRLAALQAELAKFGVMATISNNSVLTLHAPTTKNNLSGSVIRVETYDDHRMAMAFAPLALLVDEIQIENPQVVQKSYPGFWADLLDAGFEVEFEYRKGLRV